MILPRDARIVAKLAKMCLLNPVPLRCRHVAALVDKNNIVSLGMNKARSDPGFFKLSKDRRKQYIHAEFDCLNNMDADCSKYSMYVVRVDWNGNLAESAPCPICSKAIEMHNIHRVVHSIPNGIKEINYRR